MQIQRPADASGLSYWYREGPIPEGAQLRIPPGHCAVVAASGGRAIGMVVAGCHPLTRAQLPFLTQVATESSGDTHLAAELCLLPMDPHPGFEVRTPLGEVGARRGQRIDAHARVLLTIQVEDPFSLVNAMLADPEGRLDPERHMLPAVVSVVKQVVGPLVEAGELPFGTVGGAALGPLKEALMSPELELGRIGMRIADVTALEVQRGEMHAPAASGEPAFEFALNGLRFEETGTGRQAAVDVRGRFVGISFAPDGEAWVRGLISDALARSSRSFSGELDSLPHRLEEWSRWLTEAIGPEVARHTGTTGHVELLEIALRDT